ncbi:ABC transporter permease [Falsibacillus albus]|uniref:Autoinducer 2 import system permease protein LsrD n=1 Tax=Falsibacillus albus TaxID=2478915 RepID=A0A3L7JWH9_9BACI|nr:autoinducer 2 import system permease LsrD [Falsibacillus albus]RLQ94880.1 autoinducer 2 import system permease LsrD [Falsibacillus albus]
MKKQINLLLRWEMALVLFLIVEIIFFSMMNPQFLNVTNLIFSMNDYVYIGLAAIPMTFVIITGGIDVSVGSVIGLTSISIGVLWTNGMEVWLAVLIAVAISACAGAVNGGIIAYSNVQPLVVTLGTMFLFSGIALVISGGNSASGYEGISGFPDAFVQLANGLTFGLPNPLYFLIFFLLLFAVILSLTRYGRQVFLVGINMKAAVYSGIRAKFILIWAYVLAGVGGGISGVILTSYFSSARADLGAEAVLPVITAVVLGGTSITGGKGTVLGTGIASVVIGMMQYGLQMMSMTSQETSVVVGFILIIAVLLRLAKWNNIRSFVKFRSHAE